MILAEDVEGRRVVQLEGCVDGERLVPRVVGQEEVGGDIHVVVPNNNY